MPLNGLLKAPFIVNCIKNIIVNLGPLDETKPNRYAHNRVVKDTITKLACVRGTPSALDLSTLSKGPGRATLMKDLASATPVLSWLDKENMLMHLKKAKGTFIFHTLGLILKQFFI